MLVSCDEPIESWAPTTLGEARTFGFLWHKPQGGKKWTRRYAVCCSAFIVFFSEKDAPHGAPPAIFSAKPVGAICFEDLEVLPLEPLPVEKEVAAVCAFSFTIGPSDEKSKGGNFMSGATARRANLCAESERERQRWMKTLLLWRYAALCEDRVELIGTKDDLAQATARLEVAVREATEAKQEAAGHAAAAEATHSQRLEVENELYATRAQLVDTQQAYAHAESARREAMSDARKQKIFTALHKSARERLQSDMEVMKARHEAALANAATSPDSEGAGAGGFSKQKSFKLGGKASKGGAGGGGVSFGGDSDRSQESERDEGGGEGSGGRRGVGFALPGGVLKNPLRAKSAPEARKGSVVEGRKGSVFSGPGAAGSGGASVAFALPEEGGDEGGDGMRSDVDEETAVTLLARAQARAAPVTTPAQPPHTRYGKPRGEHAWL